MSDMRTLRVPENLCREAETKFGLRFGTVDEFVTAMMAELLRNQSEIMDQAEEKIIEERLKSLGYI